MDNDLTIIEDGDRLEPRPDGREGYILWKNGVRYLVPKVPEPTYQICYETAQRDFTLAWRQNSIMKILTEHVEEHFPGYGIVGFIDLDRKQARDLTFRTGSDFYWGMYLVLRENVTTTRINSHQIDEF